jgi:hypothetical protein
MAEYGQGNAYWNERYSEEDAVFEWYQSYDGFAAICSKLIKPTSHVLVLGCGNSRTSPHIFRTIASGFAFAQLTCPRLPIFCGFRDEL